MDYIEIKTIFSPKDTSESEEGERLCTSVLVLDISRALTHQEEEGKQPLDGTGLSQEVLHQASQHRKRFLTTGESQVTTTE